MTEDELIREIQLKKQLSELDGSPVPEYDSSESMTAEELRSDNRFLIDQLKEALEENRRLKEDISEIKQDLKESNRRADEESTERKNLFKRLPAVSVCLTSLRNSWMTKNRQATSIGN